ncbi:hypothetical protein [Absidia glauca]|uniref:Uncharacterized protein n=1 Tax=Absidia glauca TaxID=4829 RepID=A0A168R1D0_ABSGL|nr:hypothetical protein [Absidia glauca]
MEYQSLMSTDDQHNEKNSDYLLPPRSYGAMLTSKHSFSSSSSSNFPTRKSSTQISPNDDDQSLYLLWTHQLLVERGFTPSPIATKDDDGASSVSSISLDHDDNDISLLFSTPPSVSSPSYTNSSSGMFMDASAKADPVTRASSISSSSSSSTTSSLYSTYTFFSWLSYCFPK